MPAMAATQAPLRAVEHGQQPVALGEKGAGPTHFEVHEAREVGALGWRSGR